MNAQKVLYETHAATVNFFNVLAQNVESIKPTELPVYVELTEQAKRHVDESIIGNTSIDVTGPEFPENQKAFRLRAPAPFMGHMLKEYTAFKLDEAGLQKFEQEIKTFADIFKQHSPFD